MTASGALIVGEGWISEHYFTTDATSQSFTAKVVERRKLWDSEAAEQRPTPRSRFTEKRLELEVAFGGLGELIAPDVKRRNRAEIRQRAEAIYDLVLSVLELGPVDQPAPAAGSGDAAPVVPRVRPGQHGLQLDRNGPLVRVSQAGMTDRAPLAIILAAPCAELEDVLAKSPQSFDAGDAPAGTTLVGTRATRGGRAGADVGRSAHLRVVRRRGSPLAGADSFRPMGGARRAGTVGGGPLPRGGPAAGVRAQRHPTGR